MLASGFNRQMHRRHQKFNVLLKEMVRDGVVIEQEWDDFEVLRKELDLDEEEAELRIHHETRTRQVLACPHSGGELHPGRPKEGA